MVWVSLCFELSSLRLVAGLKSHRAQLKIFQELRIFKLNSSWVPFLPPWFWKIMAEASQLKCNLVFLIWDLVLFIPINSLMAFPEFQICEFTLTPTCLKAWVAAGQPGSSWWAFWTWSFNSGLCWTHRFLLEWVVTERLVWVATCEKMDLCVQWTFKKQMSGQWICWLLELGKKTCNPQIHLTNFLPLVPQETPYISDLEEEIKLLVYFW